MTDNIVTTHEPTHWIDPHITPAPSGSRVQALTWGGIQVSAIVDSNFLKYFDGWQPHSKIPKSIRDRQLARFTKGLE